MNPSPTDSVALAERARDLIAATTVVDLVIPYQWEIGNDARMLGAWIDAGVDLVHMHPAGDDHTASDALRRIARARRELFVDDDRFGLVERVADLEGIRADGRLGVGLHLEGSSPFERNPDLIGAFHALGIRFCHPVFNVGNAFGGGCADAVDPGLSAWGRRAVKEMNRVGMLVDGAHVGHRTTLDMLELSDAPVIFSHVGADAVHAHYRNVSDEEIDACAAGGGVIGVSGNNNYLGARPGDSAEVVFRHLDHVVQRVGAAHAGIGFDVVADTELLLQFVRRDADTWPGHWEPFEFAGPAHLPALTARMLEAGYPDGAVRGILGENWLRVGRAVWG